MPVFYDLLLVLTPDDCVQSIQFASPEVSLPNQEETDHWIGLSLEKIPNTQWDFSKGSVLWGNCRFWLRFVSPVPETRCLLLQRENQKQALMEAALVMVIFGDRETSCMTIISLVSLSLMLW